ncbi:unnamed protein product [Lactuca virosa]|uniref:WLM domain-containing protein n=1 Tax=Lactuca virosa TaxID=75947 RepID=A0AAU9NTB0_9ASTR|nr:unnamed protein product [Lactuca virosa]
MNKNKCEEMSLRLRTDDLKGFRKYQSIKKTLLHEHFFLKINNLHIFSFLDTKTPSEAPTSFQHQHHLRHLPSPPPLFSILPSVSPSPNLHLAQLSLFEAGNNGDLPLIALIVVCFCCMPPSHVHSGAIIFFVFALIA